CQSKIVLAAEVRRPRLIDAGHAKFECVSLECVNAVPSDSGIRAGVIHKVDVAGFLVQIELKDIVFDLFLSLAATTSLNESKHILVNRNLTCFQGFRIAFLPTPNERHDSPLPLEWLDGGVKLCRIPRCRGSTAAHHSKSKREGDEPDHLLEHLRLEV